MLRILASNRIESLVAGLVEAIGAAPPISPFDAEPIIVPSAAMRRHLALALADAHGICANVDFAFLAQWLWRQIGAVVPGVPEQSPFAPPVLTWRVLELLADPQFAGSPDPRHPRLAGYLAQADPVMRFELAERIAHLLEEYITYRPEWLAAWTDGRAVAPPRAGREEESEAPEVGSDEAWQAALWRRIGTALDLAHRDPIGDFFQALEALGAGPEHGARAGLAPRAHVFCLPAMPPLYIRMLHRLGRWVDLHLYVLNPCREYWFEIVDPRRLSWLDARGRAAYHEVGNPLLANWGKQTQAHLDLLLTEANDAVIDERFENDAGDAGAPLLHQVQQAILALEPFSAASLRLAPGDRSIEVHVCHSLTRELETLHDQLLAMFAADPALTPADVLVVTPDLDAAAPLIDAVFGNVPAERRIPYAVSGVAASGANPIARALLELLELATSRLAASAVFDLLQQPIVSRRFDLSAEALESVHGWLLDAAIRWDIDGAEHRALGLPLIERYDFRDGLERLLLGYAVGPSSDAPWQQRLPAGDVEGADALALGGLARFVDALAAARAQLGRVRPATAWAGTLLDLAETFFEPDDDEIDALRQTRGAIRELGRNLAAADLRAALPLNVVRRALEAQLDEAAGGGVPAGAVTFATMASLRNLPFPVVCVIGLDDGAFPTAPAAVEFDLIARRPRRGDRQRRTDERNLFLDLLLAARRRFYLSYRGRSVRDNAELPPSVLVAELLETLGPAIVLEGASDAPGATIRDRLVVHHPLQPFSVAAFGAGPGADPRGASFHAEYGAALRARLRAAPALPSVDRDDEAALIEDTDENGNLGSPGQQQPFFAFPLAAPEAQWREVTLDALIEFFFNPCRYLLRQRLGVAWLRASDPLPDEEPFVPDYKAPRDLAERLLPAHRAGADAAALRALAGAVTGYPPGRLGEAALEREVAAIRRYGAALALAGDGEARPPVSGEWIADLDGERWRLTGTLADLRPTGQLLGAYDKLNPWALIAAWLKHLFLCQLRPDGVALQTLWLGRDCGYRLRPCAQPAPILQQLLLLYRRGLCRPLHFFPRTALAYVESNQSLAEARGRWRSHPQRPFGEDRDPAYRLALRGVDDPLDHEFEQVALAVFGPMFGAAQFPDLVAAPDEGSIAHCAGSTGIGLLEVLEG
jgi:exodeoxyribonuclease V gamma subunit